MEAVPRPYGYPAAGWKLISKEFGVDKVTLTSLFSGSASELLTEVQSLVIASVISGCKPVLSK
jgi:hypothetical protein